MEYSKNTVEPIYMWTICMLTGIWVSFPPTKNIPSPLLSAAISIVVSFPGVIGHVSGSAGGSEINNSINFLKILSIL